MNFETTMERAVPMQTQHMMTGARQGRAGNQHRDTNPKMLVLAVVGFIAMSWGAVMLTSYLESGRQAKTHQTGKALPPIFVRQ